MNLFKIEKVTAIPAVEDRKFSCIYVVKSVSNINKAELYMTGSNSLDLVHISTESLITSLINKLNIQNNPLVLGIGFKDNATTITTGTNVAYVRSPRAFLCTSFRASVNAPSTSGSIKIDILKSGVSILPLAFNTSTQQYETKYLQIDQGQESSKTSTIQFSNFYSSISDDEKITINVIEAGTGATGLIVSLSEGLDPNAY